MGVRSSRLALLATTVVLAAASSGSFSSPVQASRLACGVCEALVDEVNLSILSTAATHSVQTRFRVDEKKRVPYSRTEHNLLEILEGEALASGLAKKYGLVKPHGRTSRLMKAAYNKLQQQIKQLESEGTEGAAAVAEEANAAEAAASATAAEAAKVELPEAPETPVSATTTEDAATPSTIDAAAAAAGATADSAAAAGSDAPAATPAATPAAPVFEPFVPTGPVPLALVGNHVHLAPAALHARTGLVVEVGSGVSDEIRDTLEAFLEDHLDQTMLMFHRDIEDIKTKLCIDATEVCKPIKHNKKQNKKKTTQKAKPPAKPKAAATKKAPAAPAPEAVKDEL